VTKMRNIFKDILVNRFVIGMEYPDGVYKVITTLKEDYEGHLFYRSGMVNDVSFQIFSLALHPANQQTAGRIRYAQPFPPYNLSSVFSVHICSLTVLKIYLVFVCLVF